MTEPQWTATHNEPLHPELRAQLDSTSVEITAKRGKLTQKALFVEANDRHIRHLDQRLSSQEGELERLRAVEIEHAKYHTASRFTTITLLVCAPAVLLGTCLISQYAGATATTDVFWRGFGWSLVIIGLAIEFLVGIFSPLAH